MNIRKVQEALEALGVWDAIKRASKTGGGGGVVSAISAGVSRFISLLDAPNSYTGQAGKIVSVKGDETGLEFIENSGGSGDAVIPQYDNDPVAPTAEDAWVLRTPGSLDGDAGQPRGLLLALTYSGIATSNSYQFSYRTQQGTTVRTSLA